MSSLINDYLDATRYAWGKTDEYNYQVTLPKHLTINKFLYDDLIKVKQPKENKMELKINMELKIDVVENGFTVHQSQPEKYGYKQFVATTPQNLADLIKELTTEAKKAKAEVKK